MAVWGYEFYLLVLKVSLTSSLDFHEKIKFVSPSGHVISSIFIVNRFLHLLISDDDRKGGFMTLNSLREGLVGKL